jgi:hypothetical protein
MVRYCCLMSEKGSTGLVVKLTQGYPAAWVAKNAQHSTSLLLKGLFFGHL